MKCTLLVLVVCVGAVFAADTSLAARRSELKKLLADDWEYQLRTFPELATRTGDRRFND